jgi:MATE family multidrug resistance protein
MTKRAWKEPLRPGGTAELLRLALPLILSNSFWTLQIAIDRAFLSRLSSDAVAASMPAAILFWTPLTLLQNTANYATTFVAQYVGAGRRLRVGPAVWQAIYFAMAAGVLFLLFYPFAEPLVALGGHSARLQGLEVTYFHCLCFSALPILITAAANSFFAGRGDSWTVFLIDGTGMTANALFAYGLIFGHWGLPALGMAGAGLATVGGSSISAMLGLGLMLRPQHRAEFATLEGRAFDPALFRRLLRFGLPNGMQWCLEALAFTVFLFLVGRLGGAELAATSITFTLNMVAFFPTLGVGQGVAILVGQRLGQDRPDLAERTTWTGFRLAWLYMVSVAVLYVSVPDLFLFAFHPDSGATDTLRLHRLVTVLLRFVAVYSLFDSMNAVFSFALRGAGDTRFVTAVAVALAWPIMVLPTWAAWYYDWGLYWAWAFASAYVISLALVFLFRFRHGKWKSMRVIEPAVIPENLEATECLATSVPSPLAGEG